MDESIKTAIKLGAFGVAIYLAYEYLQSSGLWGQWFGGGNNFTDSSKLLSYCQANPNGTAGYTAANGQQTTAACSAWISANKPGSSAAAGAGTQPPAATQVDQSLLAKLQASAIANPALGSDSASIDQWNYLLTQIDTQAKTTDLSEAGVVRGVNDTMNAAGYLALRAKANLSGIGEAFSRLSWVPDPYMWVN